MAAIELSRVDRTYAWAVESGNRTYPITSLFEDRDIEDVPTSEAKRRVIDALDAVAPDAVAVPGWSAPAALAAMEWCRRTGKPVVLMSESTAHDEPRRWWREAGKGRVVQMASSALVGGAPHRDYIVRLGIPAERVFLGYDVVDNAHFSAGADAVRENASGERGRLGLPATFFLASNRFIEKKNLPNLLQAYDRYRRRAAPEAWHLVLLGDGPLRAAVEGIVRELNLGGWVRLPGFQQYGDLPAYYGLAGAFVQASTSEQWGLVVNEAMAAGLPVLVSNRCGCAPDLVADGENGYSFDPSDVAALADRMLTVASDSCDREAMGRRSREIIANWIPETFAKGLMDAATAALAAPHPASRLHDRALLWAAMRR